ncbi:tyrosine-type recombinase/integrase [Arenibacter algicola]|uniref:tyrosine-type recombinase/integrase n=1 Tax=Arenibacter algicola TaxID=616991 RepID=UPI001C076F37|nr:tyrosine-type recombinase/integrase [Arenibacter algicola]MBU2904695.1 tyrosine-type recombinase/integrase [Arenibacter algicola]
MATVNFLYRSTRDAAYLNIRLLYRLTDSSTKEGYQDYTHGAKTQIKVTRHYWNKEHNIKRTNDISLLNKQKKINDQLTNLQIYVLDKFDSADKKKIDKDWFKTIIEQYYNPVEANKKEIPTDLVNYIDFYIEFKKHELTPKAIKRINVTKNKMQRLQAKIGKTILIKDIDENFKKEFQDYSNLEKYSQNTQQRELVLIKTLCYHAKHLGLETHYQLDGLKLKRQEVKHIYLTFDEISHIKTLKLPFEHLENARDWLLISCFTGQRVSDFMKFNKSMIRIKQGKHLLEFKQQKTGKLMTIPLPKEAREVLDKRNGEFPRPISDQKYNDYIKKVCELAELNEIVEGKKRINITPDLKKGTYRDIVGNYPKWELVSSHIGRRSFCTNYYSKVPTSYLIAISGHSSEKMFLNYIKKSEEDKALDAYDYFN